MSSENGDYDFFQNKKRATVKHGLSISQMTEEGYLKFNCIREDENLNITPKLFEAISYWRQKMFHSGLIGVYSNGIGYGNISSRTAGGFLISGTSTGKLPFLEQKHYAEVKSWSFTENSLICSGKIAASAESLSHAALYELLPEIGAVIHIHHKGMWDKLLPVKQMVTSPGVLYGTPEMANEIQQMVRHFSPGQDSILIMGGHEEGIIAWGETLDDAGETILKYFQAYLAEKQVLPN